MCLYSKLIKNPKYKSNKKNGGVVPVCDDPRKEYVPIGCGWCSECRKAKAYGWRVRLFEEIKKRTDGQFATFTFSEERYEKLRDEVLKETPLTDEYLIDNLIATKATRAFLERWRGRYKKSLRHWLVTELGHEGTERIHIHGIIFTNIKKEIIQDVWSYGWYDNGKGYINESGITYITKYILKIDEKHKTYKPKILTSSGIGSNWTKGYNAKLAKKEDKYTSTEGYKFALPIYYRNKIFTEKERAELWMKKLDEEIRYVCGEKVSIKESEKEYERLTEYYRQKDKMLGYGNGEITADEKIYKLHRAMMRAITKAKKAGQNEYVIKEIEARYAKEALREINNSKKNII